MQSVSDEPLKSASPPYVAVSVLLPALVETSEQVPSATSAKQVLPSPSSTVTVPVGVPAPGAFTVTDHDTS